MSERILSIADAVSIGAIIGAVHHDSKVARLMSSGDVIVGIPRSIGDSRGAFLASGEDVRDGFLRVTSTTGWEHFWPMSDLIREHQATTFVLGYQE